MAFVVGFSVGLFAQENNRQGANTDPNVHITVHKQTDPNGNVISYDSVYTYSYSGKCCHNSAYVDSIMRKYGMNGMGSMFFSMPLNTPDISSYPFAQEYGSMDVNKLQQMMQNQMNQMMQMYGTTPPCNGFFCQPAPSPKCYPQDSTQYHQQGLDKKDCPKHNKVKGGVQI